MDVFSFGVVLWELLMYKPTIAAIPFQGVIGVSTLSTNCSHAICIF